MRRTTLLAGALVALMVMAIPATQGEMQVRTARLDTGGDDGSSDPTPPRCDETNAISGTWSIDTDGFDLTEGTYNDTRTASNLTHLDITDNKTIDTAKRFVGLQFGFVDFDIEVPLDHVDPEGSVEGVVTEVEPGVGTARLRLWPGEGWFRGTADHVDMTSEFHDHWDSQLLAGNEYLRVTVKDCRTPDTSLFARDLLTSSGDAWDANAHTGILATVEIDDDSDGGMVRKDQLVVRVQHGVTSDVSPLYFVRIEARLQFVFEVDDRGSILNIRTISNPDPQTGKVNATGEAPGSSADTWFERTEDMSVVYAPILPLQRLLDEVPSVQDGSDGSTQGADAGVHRDYFGVGDARYIIEYEVDEAGNVAGQTVDPFNDTWWDVTGTIGSTELTLAS